MLSNSSAMNRRRPFGKFATRGANGTRVSSGGVTPGRRVRRVYFSFDYEQDLRRVRQVSALPGILVNTAAGLEDSSLWRRACNKGEMVTRSLIENGIANTDVTVVCLDTYTTRSKHVIHEVERTLALGHGLLGLHVSHLPVGTAGTGGPSPRGNAPVQIMSEGFKIHEYTDPDALAQHIEQAAAIAGL